MNETSMPAWLVALVGALLCVGGAWAVYAAQTEVDDTVTGTGPYRPEMIVVPAGKFTMGSPKGEEGRLDSEDQVEVEITRAFALGRTQVTQGQWTALMGGNPSYFKGDDRPVELVNWYEALTYLNRLSKSEGLDACYTLKGCTGQLNGGCSGEEKRYCRGDYQCGAVEFLGLDCTGYRLPTEAEWEFAARAETQAAQYGPLDEIAWYTGNAKGETHPVQRKSPNRWHLADMLGNVWEWTHDGYDSALKGGADPLGKDWSSADGRVLRGCGFYNTARLCRAACRNSARPLLRYDYLGLRPARSFP